MKKVKNGGLSGASIMKGKRKGRGKEGCSPRGETHEGGKKERERGGRREREKIESASRDGCPSIQRNSTQPQRGKADILARWARSSEKTFLEISCTWTNSHC